jgi:hypothetical protein
MGGHLLEDANASQWPVQPDNKRWPKAGQFSAVAAPSSDGGANLLFLGK